LISGLHFALLFWLFWLWRSLLSLCDCSKHLWLCRLRPFWRYRSRFITRLLIGLNLRSYVGFDARLIIILTHFLRESGQIVI